MAEGVEFELSLGFKLREKKWTCPGCVDTPRSTKVQ